MEPSATQSDDVDGAALNTIIQRFRAHHATRIVRTGERLISRHRRVLEALPMLYHRNHPALPGYTGADVPHGIAGYRPDADHLQALRMVARSYVEPRFPPARTDLHSVFLMGSGGTVGQTRGSDIDLWVCCDTLLHAALWPKVRMIDQWAGELGLELHTFLVDPDVLRTRRSLPGCRIPMLVLDEFYRSGALMAGRYPLWWLVPHDDPAQYAAMAQRLIQRRFVPADAVVDFGPVPPFPPDELAHAAITELERALSTPHKSLLKLKLMETYAEAPQLGAVSSVYRTRVHAGETDALQLDPYLLLYEHVERHLQSVGRDDELAFARALLIGKTAESIPWQRQPDPLSGQTRSLPERFLQWGFDAAAVARFRTLDGWTMGERLVEHDRIMNALERGVSLVQSLVDKAAASDGAASLGKESASLGKESASWRKESASETTAGPQLHRLNDTRLRRLRLAVGHMRPRDQHDIEELHPALITRRRPLILELVRDRNRWVIREGEALVACCRRLVEAVIWAELNGAGLVPAKPETAVSHTLAQVLQGFRGAQRSLYVFVNAEARHQRVPPSQVPGGDIADGGAATLLTLRNDPLDYGGFHQLHLETFDLVSRDASGHWRLESLVDDAALLEGLGRVLASPPATVSWQVLGGQERFQLAHRLEQLHTLAERVLDGPGALFVLPFGADMVTLKRLGAAVETRRHRSLAELQGYLQTTGCTTLGVDPVSQRLKALLRAS